jgi:hypothetical protein
MVRSSAPAAVSYCQVDLYPASNESRDLVISLSLWLQLRATRALPMRSERKRVEAQLDTCKRENERSSVVCSQGGGG